MTEYYRGKTQVDNTVAYSFNTTGFAVLLTILFVIFKLTGVVAWSWVWVLSPLWISLGFSLLFILLLFGFVLAANIFRR